MSQTRSAEPRLQSDDGYVVRQYEPADREQFLSLYEDVFEKSRTPEWFEWRYGGPYTDEVRMFVAERGGELVGAEPFISFDVRVGEVTVSAVQPADAMVHPDHRRNGLLTRMTERALERYTAGEPSFVFNFPNPEAKPAYLKLGWREVGSVATSYRIENPSAFLGADRRLLGTGVSAATRGYLTMRDRGRLGRRNPGVTVGRHSSIPADRFASLYSLSAPETLHVPREKAFYRWRFANPNWETAAYTAERDGRTVASLVACTEESDRALVTKVMDALPMAGAEREAAAFERLLAALIDDHPETDVFAVAEGTLPESVLSRLGFLGDDEPPLSFATSPTPVVARSLSSGDEWNAAVAERFLTDRANWRLTFAEQDTSV
ncbi:GNAT family N-acetyltransferase [Halegenticoccus soli]|uniref:GNAT family N-acetyltransferase n=1 Tax=Halegenticoccus soli TaxID=1985678 RepID=UPI000C6D8902|nr:GNAT family N-acetyltransferase [Halegenticoccus soli]